MILSILLLSLLFPGLIFYEDNQPKIVWLKSNNILTQPTKYTSALDVYCYSGKKIKLKFLLSSAKVWLKFKKNGKNDYLLFKHTNVSEIYKQYKQANANWYNLFPSWRPTKINLEPFKVSCIGVGTKEEYSVIFNFFIIDYIKILSLMGGILSFFMANTLCRNELFYYTFGSLFGIVASLLILVYLISNMVPKKSVATYLILASGWSFGLFILQYIWENIQVILNLYGNFVTAYIALTGLLSFIICYYKGPPKNPRALQIIKWAIQAISFYLIYFATSNIHEASLCLYLAMIVCNKLFRSSRFNPFSHIKRSMYIYMMKRFPPKTKLLTQEEFAQQGIIETQKALENLKNYCNTSQQPWKLAKTLKDPKRFASFIEGDSMHVSEPEIEEWENETHTYKRSSRGNNHKGSRNFSPFTFKNSPIKPSAPPLVPKSLPPLNKSKSPDIGINNSYSKSWDKYREVYPSLHGLVGDDGGKKRRIGDYLKEADDSDESSEDQFSLVDQGIESNKHNQIDGIDDNDGSVGWNSEISCEDLVEGEYSDIEV